MTFEHKLSANLTEIKAVVFECVTCNARIAIPVEVLSNPPSQCPQGHAWDWNFSDSGHSNPVPVKAFLGALKFLRNPMIEKTGFRLLLEYEMPTANSHGH
ncbi:MAG: hypothetical protein ABSC71_17980 [Candidatus Acidiferrales bacterium]|jgi:hypothetical protein